MNSLLTSLSERLLANAFGVALAKADPSRRIGAKADHQLVAPKPGEGGSLLTIRRPRLPATLRRLPRKRSGLFIGVFGIIYLAVFGQVKAVDSDTFYGGNAGNNTTTGIDDSAFGYYALNSVTTGSSNTAIGSKALDFNSTGSANTATGAFALGFNSTGYFNTAAGAAALFNNNGSANTASGYEALYSNTTGNYNTAAGFSALALNTTGDSNTAAGTDALSNNTTGHYNTATGDSALAFNTTGSYNLANGYATLYSNTTGSYNLANGYVALYSNTIGFFNMGNGVGALYKNTTGGYNVAEGLLALYNNTTGGSNIAIGTSAGINLTTGSANIDIGNAGVAGESRTIRIGTQGTQTFAYMAGIRGVAAPGGVGVMIDSNGKLGTVVSSARFKEMIEPMDKASDAILSLKPVTFHYKKEWDPAGIRQYGLVAEEVEKVAPELVARDEKGKPYSVRYEAINAMLLNEFLKEHQEMEDQTCQLEEQGRKIQEQRATIAQLKQDFQSKLAAQEKQIRALASGLEKVSAQLEASKPAPQVVNNP